MPASGSWLLCRVHTSWCALPLAHVVEVMRPLPVTPIAHAPECVLGMCVMRGVAVAVVDAARCVLGRALEKPARFVAVRSGQRRIALAVDEVRGTAVLTPERVEGLPPLLAAASSAVAALSSLDRELLLLLQAGRVVADFALPELPQHARHD